MVCPQQYERRKGLAMFQDASLGARHFQVAADTAFYEADTPARTLYFIHVGQVGIFQAGNDASWHILETLGPGDWFGIPALTRGPDPGYGAGAVALTPAIVSEVTAARLMATLAHHPEVARELLAQISSELQGLRSRTVAFSAKIARPAGRFERYRNHSF